MVLTRDFASLPHGRFAFIEKEVFPRQRPECNDDAWLAKYRETKDLEWRARLMSGVQCHAGPREGTERSDNDITGARSCQFAAKNVTNGRNHDGPCATARWNGSRTSGGALDAYSG